MYIYRGSSSPVGKFVRFVQFLRPVEFPLRTVELNLLVLQANKFLDKPSGKAERERVASEQSSSAMGLISPTV